MLNGTPLNARLTSIFQYVMANVSIHAQSRGRVLRIGNDKINDLKATCYSVIMNLNHWCELDELIYVSQTDEEHKQYSGLKYSEKLIEQLAQMKIRNSTIFVDFFSHPRPLFLCPRSKATALFECGILPSVDLVGGQHG